MLEKKESHRPKEYYKFMTIVISEDKINQIILQLADKIYNSNSGDIVFLGLGDNGAILANRLSSKIQKEHEKQILVGKLEVGLYKSPETNDHFVTIGKSDIRFSLKNKTVILITDQVKTGRTMIAGLNALSDYSEADIVKCCCVIFRNCMRRPIYFEYIGETVSVPENQQLSCHFYETDGEDVIKSYV
jgi:pyrimidine operon attenuation protein/uracil phosphoribosyltransferase